jgi:coenzyme F420-reducing hydrogenase gamma subunit
MGPVTQAGCNALCPSLGRGCYGCFGPMESPDTAALAALFEKLGSSKEDIVRMFRNFNAYAEPFRLESETYERTK